MSFPPQGNLGTWSVLPPAGLTETGRIRRFQDRTVQKLQSLAQSIAQPAFEELQRVVASTYQEGTGELLGTLQYKVDATRDGVEISFMAGTRHVVFLTALAGEGAPSQGHWIRAHNTSKSMLRFFWKNPPGGTGPGVYHMQQVFWQPRRSGGADVIGEVLQSHAVRFEQEMVRAHDAALVQFVQENAQPATSSPRVSAFNENDIPPQ